MNIKACVGVFLAVVLLLGQSPMAHGKKKKKKKLEAVERLDIDPVLHGVWYLHMTSKDKGKTVKTIKPPWAFCKAGASKVKMEGGDILRVEKVLVLKGKKAKWANVIRFVNGTIWIVSKIPDTSRFLVQSGKGGKELIRFAVSVK